MATGERQGRFTDPSPGGGVVQGYRDAIQDDPFNKAFLRRNYRDYGVLKKAGLGKKGGLGKLKGLTDTQLEAIATKAVMQKHGIERRKLNTKLNHQKYNIKWAKQVMAKRRAGQPVRQQALRATAKARKHIAQVQRNRAIQKTTYYPHVPKGF